MGIFGEQAERLLRESWPTVTMLAEELYAIFTSTEPTTIDGPLTINNPTTDQPALVARNLGGSNVAVQIERYKPPELGDLPPLPDIPPFYPGNIEITELGTDGQLGTAQGDAQDPPAPQIKGSGGGIPCQIQSGGPGAGPYIAKVFPNGIKAAALKVSVTQLQIDANETIPPGTWTIASQIGALYYVQVPVWLDQPPPI